MVSYFSNTSFYKKTSFGNVFRGHYKPIILKKDSRTDIDLVITQKYHQRPGKLAFDLYGDPRLNWVFAAYNKNIIIDPIYDLVDGLKIKVPEKGRLMDLI